MRELHWGSSQRPQRAGLQSGLARLGYANMAQVRINYIAQLADHHNYQLKKLSRRSQSLYNQLGFVVTRPPDEFLPFSLSFRAKPSMQLELVIGS